jgi:hypothetical protein
MSLDLTGSDWGLRKKTQRQTYRKAGVGWSSTPDERRHNPFYLQAHVFIQQVWENQVKGRLSSHGSRCIGSRNSAVVVCCYLLQTILTRSACLVFLARQPCWTLPLLSWVHPYQPRGPLTELCSCQGYFHCLSLPTCKAALLNLAHLLRAGTFPSQQKGFWRSLAHVEDSSQST